MTTPDSLKHTRVLLKLSGEAFQGDNASLCADAIARIIDDVANAHALGVQVAIVVGAGNFFRGATLGNITIRRSTADQMGMMATVINALALRDALQSQNVPARILSAIPVGGVADHANHQRAIEHLESGRVVIFAGGTGNPFVTTDSAASLRGIQIEADILLKGTQVDGIYDKDPKQHADAIRYDHLTFQQAVRDELAVMDLTAFYQCRDHNLPIRVFSLTQPGVLRDALIGKAVGTLVTQGDQS